MIDFVGGQADLAARVVRAIGVAERRFEEDHLRLLRAVRFAARFGFAVEPGTARAIRDHAPQLTRISPERIADELRAMLPPATRAAAWQLLNELDLARVVFRFVDVPAGEPDDDRPIDGFFHMLSPDEPTPFPLAMAAAAAQWLWWASPKSADARRAFEKPAAAKVVGALRRSLRLSNDECDAIEGTYAGLGPLLGDALPGVAAMKRFLARPTSGFSRRLMAAMSAGGVLDAARAGELERELVSLAQSDFAPAPLITGDDLTAAGAKPGPAFKRMLDAAYDAQLEGRAMTREEAMAIALSAGKVEPQGRAGSSRV